MKTRQEHIEAMGPAILALNSSWREVARRAVDYAIEQGMPVAPEQVEPKVDDELTETTRLVHRMAVIEGCVVWQYDHAILAWRNAIDNSTIPVLGKAHWQLFGARIVLVPSGPLTLEDYAGEPVTEQMHEATVTGGGDQWGWLCTCKAVNLINYGTRARAACDAEAHIEDQS